MIKKLEGCYVVVERAGLMRELPLYHRGNNVLAKIGTGYARLTKTKLSVPKTLIVELGLDLRCYYDAFGYLRLHGDKTPAVQIIGDEIHLDGQIVGYISVPTGTLRDRLATIIDGRSE